MVSLPPQDAHYLTHVLRLGPDDLVTLVSSIGNTTARGVIAAISPELKIEIIEIDQTQINSSRVGALVFALSKGKKNDLVCEKACELGVRHLILWCSQHSVVQISDERSEEKLLRWQKVCDAAAQQSGNPHITQVSFAPDLQTLEGILDSVRAPTDTSLICALSPNAVPARSLARPTHLVHLAVGPEGDFSGAELTWFSDHGFHPITLGPLVLRCETAAIAALATVHALWQDA